MNQRIFELPINIHVGEIRIERGFKFELFDGNYFDIIDQYNDLYSDLIDIYGRDDIDKIVEICNNTFRNQKYVIVKDGLIRQKGSIISTNLNFEKFTIDYKYEGEFLQLFQFILNTTSNKFKVVDFNDEEFATTKTLSEARRIFKSKYPYMEERLIDNFIYKI